MLQIVIVYMGLYEHWALLSDKVSGGKPMLISNTWRNGTVKEEAWDQVVGGRPYKIHAVKPSSPAHVILTKARNAAGHVKYDLIRYNCEHFINDMITGVAKSSQVRQMALIGSLTFAVSVLLSKKQ